MTIAPMSRLGGVEKIWSAIACAALVAFPALLLRFPSAANTGFTVLLLWGLWVVVVSPRSGDREWRVVGRSWPMVVGMAGLPLALLFHQLVHWQGIPGIPYVYSRFALFALLACGFLRLGGAVRLVQWGLVVGAIGSAVWIHVAAAHGRPSHVGVNNVIPFANLSLTMGILAWISIGWNRRDEWLQIALKVIAGAAALYTSYLSATRGSWIAIPILLLIVLVSSRRLTVRNRWRLLLLLLAVIGVLGYSSDVVTTRVHDAVRSLAGYMEANVLDTSEGIRLQLWRGSMLLLAEHPLTGVGPDNWAAALSGLVQRGVLTPKAASFDHSHNDLFYAAATLGVPGLIAVLALYLVPMAYFLRHLRCPDGTASIAAAMGLATAVGFLVFGLTESMFYIAMTNAFYVVIMAACFALVAGRNGQSEAVCP